MAERVYEMLWDCSACGTTGLLGKSQRRCPNCGSPQDPTKRYFPKPGEEVAVHGHLYEGVDWRCAACETPNGAAASFCANCGNPKEGNKAVALKADGDVAPKLAAPPPAAPKGRLRWGVAAALGLLLVSTCATLLFVKKDVTVDVVGHSWKREIDIERFDAARDSAWCDQTPHDAYSVSRHREVRSHRDVADGEECHDKRVDQGDGTFAVKTECRTKYRSEPVYDDKCHFLVNRWQVARTDRATGQAMMPSPSWPALRLSSVRGGLGAEREGARRQSYEVQLRDARAPQKTWTCDFPEDKWRSIADGARLSMKVRLVGSAVCETLR